MAETVLHEPTAGPSDWSIRPHPVNTKKTKAAGVGAEVVADEIEDSEDDSSSDDSSSQDPVYGPRVGVGPHESERYRAHLIPFQKFKDTNFIGNPDAVAEAANLIVCDMTSNFNCGLVIPQDAPRDFRG